MLNVFTSKMILRVWEIYNIMYNNKNENMLSCIQTVVAETINKKILLPDYAVVILDNDLLDYLDFKGMGCSVMISTWLEWLFNQLHVMFLTCKQQLKKYAKSKESPFVYWVELPKHENFHVEDNTACGKFNLYLTTLVKKFPNIRLVKMKEFWAYDNLNLVVNNKITVEGLAVYWHSVDAAIKFNIAKRNQFLAKSVVEASSQQSLGSHPEDMKKFFHRNKAQEDRFHWSSKKRKYEEESRCYGNTRRRFALPKLHH